MIILCMWLSQSILGQGTVPKIDIESVRKDIMIRKDYLFPDEYIKNIDQSKFGVIYLDDCCLVHIAYKNSDTHSSEKFSHIVIYSLKGKIWIYQNSIPYYYNLELLNAKEKIFFSNNLFCDMNGSCNRLTEISKFDGQNLLSMVKYEGYDNALYFDRLLIFEQREKILNTVCDTICNDFVIADIDINEKGLNYCGLTHKVVIFKDIVSDTLQTINNHTYSKIQYGPK